MFHRPNRSNLRAKKIVPVIAGVALLGGLVAASTGQAFASSVTTPKRSMDKTVQICNSRSSGYTSAGGRTLETNLGTIYVAAKAPTEKFGKITSYCAIFWHSQSSWGAARYTGIEGLKVSSSYPGGLTLKSDWEVAQYSAGPIYVPAPTGNSSLVFRGSIGPDTSGNYLKKTPNLTINP